LTNEIHLTLTEWKPILYIFPMGQPRTPNGDRLAVFTSQQEQWRGWIPRRTVRARVPYTHLPLCHGHTLFIVTDTHQHMDRGLFSYMTSYLAQAYRLSILIDKPTLFIKHSSWLIRLWVDNVLLINTRSLLIVIDHSKPIPVSIGISSSMYMLFAWLPKLLYTLVVITRWNLASDKLLTWQEVEQKWQEWWFENFFFPEEWLGAVCFMFQCWQTLFE
jgi:hypothetical protein